MKFLEKYFICFIIFLGVTGVCSSCKIKRESGDTIKAKSYTSEKNDLSILNKTSLITTEELIAYDRLKLRSLLKVTNSKGIPACLYDHDLDIKSNINVLYTKSFYSSRLEFFKMIDSKKVLKAIIKEDFFKTQFDGLDGYLPSDDISNHELAVLRLKEIQEDKDTLSKIEFYKNTYDRYYSIENPKLYLGRR